MQTATLSVESKKHQTYGFDDAANEVIFFLYSVAPDAEEQVGTLGLDWRNHHNGNRTGMLGRLQTKSVEFPWPNSSSFSVPYFLPRPSFDAMRKEVFDDLTALNAMTFSTVKHSKDAILLTPDAVVSFDIADSFGVNYTFCVNDFYLAAYHRANNFTKLDASFSSSQKLTSFDISLIPLLGELQLMSLIHNSFWLNFENRSVRKKIEHAKTRV